VGSISGAAPVVAGYCAVTDRFDGAALILFLILVLWQMPHFYAIAMYRFDDYKNAGLPVLPVKKGWHATKVQIVVYIAAFVLAVGSLTAFGYAGYIFGIIMMLVGVAWLRQGIRGFTTDDNRQWARKLFFVSLLVILALSIMLSVGSRLASIASTTYLFVRPSTRILHATYGLVALTLVSGTYLAWSTQAHLLSTCVAGLVYVLGVSFGIVTARAKLIRVKSE